MKDGICPKCEAQEVRIILNNAPTGLFINVGFFNRNANLIYYVCTNCGYVELFVQDKDFLPKIAEKYQKVR